jgi:prepilin-type N-terminal cleavage/methylation domain-containing protein
VDARGESRAESRRDDQSELSAIRTFRSVNSTRKFPVKKTGLRGGFTLIELLVVIAIIAVITALLLGVVATGRQRSDSVQCLANLREIGAAINAYAAEHDDLLPGPLGTAQSANYGEATAGSLARLLEKYLTAPAMAPDGTRKSSAFLCPAAVRAAHSMALPAYLVSMVPFPAYGQCAWGDPALEQQPLSRSALGSIGDIQKDGAPLFTLGTMGH